MIPLLIAGPAVEPVTLAKMRAYLRLDDDAEDDLVAALIKAARLVVEAAAGRQLVEQSWRLTLDRWPCGRAVLLPLSPLIRIERIRVFDRFGAPEDLAAALYRAERASDIVVESAAPERGSRRKASRSTSSSASGRPPATCRRRSLRACACSSRAGSRTAATRPPT